jgi:hypothetical protein
MRSLNMRSNNNAIGKIIRRIWYVVFFWACGHMLWIKLVQPMRNCEKFLFSQLSVTLYNWEETDKLFWRLLCSLITLTWTLRLDHFTIRLNHSQEKWTAYIFISFLIDIGLVRVNELWVLRLKCCQLKCSYYSVHKKIDTQGVFGGRF